jgi:hypothetical protein
VGTEAKEVFGRLEVHCQDSPMGALTPSRRLLSINVPSGLPPYMSHLPALVEHFCSTATFFLSVDLTIIVLPSQLPS